ncbi:MAG TPA: hypothetical protein VKS20_06225 [Candidatus Acidoferrales bacterium]|nr:hypothetical protein [Candidatus Acidoferrales bacterium]
MIGHPEFLQILRDEFPEFRDELEQWAEINYPDHLLMMELYVFFEDAVANSDWARVARSLSVLDRVFKEADKPIKNVVYVSFLENIDLSQPSSAPIIKLMSPALLRGHGEIDSYMMESGVRQKSYRPLSE